MSLKQSAQCAILCADPLFRSYLKGRMSAAQSQRLMTGARQVEAWEIVRSKEDAAIAVRFLLDIDSRRDLDLDEKSAARWSEMAGDFAYWKAGGE